MRCRRWCREVPGRRQKCCPDSTGYQLTQSVTGSVGWSDGEKEWAIMSAKTVQRLWRESEAHMKGRVWMGGRYCCYSTHVSAGETHAIPNESWLPKATALKHKPISYFITGVSQEIPKSPGDFIWLRNEQHGFVGRSHDELWGKCGKQLPDLHWGGWSFSEEHP